MHATGDAAAAHVTAAETTVVASAKACMAAEAAGMSAAGVTSAVLRPQGYGQDEGERRDGDQATHMSLL